MTQRGLLRLLALGVLVLILLLAWQLGRSYADAIENATDDAGNLVSALDAQLTATLRRVESNLHNIAAQLPAVAPVRAGAPVRRRMAQPVLRRFSDNFPEVNGFFVWSRDGELLASSEATDPGPIRIDHRPGFLELRAEPEAQITFSDSISSRIYAQDTVAVYVPVRNARGGLDAVVTSTLNIDRITRSFESLQLPQGSVIFMRRSDNHKLVLRYPYVEREINKPVRNAIQQRIDQGIVAGRDRFQAVTDGEWRLYGFRKLQGYPYYVVVGLAQRSALANWHRNARYLVGGVVLLGVAMLFLLWQMARLERQRAQAQREAGRAQDLLREAIDSLSAGIVVYDEQDRLIAYNEAMRQLYAGFSDVIVPGRTFEEITRAGAQRGSFTAAIGRTEAWLAERMQQHRAADGVPYEQELADGRWVQFTEHRTPAGHTVGTRIDITERKQLENELRDQATTDALTGLPNRRHFLARLDEEVERVRRRTTQQACVLMMDLDHFKRINDQFGHAAGDSLLRHFAQLLAEELRSTDTCGRMGGEEFAVILPGTDVKAAEVLARRICSRLAGVPLRIGTQQVYVTVSMGIAAIDPADLTADTVLSRADGALYQAKEAGRNRVAVAT
jgi:diguanylate cyclase (GGDEF)-like protein/PAS domain S-box-containing protein